MCKLLPTMTHVWFPGHGTSSGILSGSRWAINRFPGLYMDSLVLAHMQNFRRAATSSSSESNWMDITPAFSGLQGLVSTFGQGGESDDDESVEQDPDQQRLELFFPCILCANGMKLCLKITSRTHPTLRRRWRGDCPNLPSWARAKSDTFPHTRPPPSHSRDG